MPLAQPDAHARLEAAALDLFNEQGYAATTVLDIVQRAGVARRTFFRYFTHKREVLFWGTPTLQDAYTAAVAAAPLESSPLELARHALFAAAEIQGGDRRGIVRRRQAVIDANPELQERQLLKRSQRAKTLTDALVDRGVGPREAAVTAHAALAAYAVAFHSWASGESDDLAPALEGVLDALRHLDRPLVSQRPREARPRPHS